MDRIVTDNLNYRYITITAKKMRDIFKEKTFNIVGFLIATLIAEGLLKVSEGSLRNYERVPKIQKIPQANFGADPSPEKKSAKYRKPKNEEQS